MKHMLVPALKTAATVLGVLFLLNWLAGTSGGKSIAGNFGIGPNSN